MQELPLVSVVIPTHNRVNLLRRALESVRSQTYPKMEVIVVDDASEDATLSTLAAVPDVRTIAQTSRSGAAASRNRGIEAATGDLVAFLDSDDEWLPEKIAKQVDLIQGSDDIGAVYCRHFDHDDVTNVRQRARSTLYRGDISEHLQSGHCPRTVSLFLVRKSALQAIGGFDESLAGFQDTDLWLRLAHDWRFDAVDEHLAVVHNHPGTRITTDITARRRALDQFIAKWGNEMAKRIGDEGVTRYRSHQLAVAQGQLVLDLVSSGKRRLAVRELFSYLKLAGTAHPRQLLGLLVALAWGTRAHAALKALNQRRSARTIEP